MKKFLSKKKNFEELEETDYEKLLNVVVAKPQHSNGKQMPKKSLRSIVKSQQPQIENILSKQHLIHDLRMEMKHKIESFSEYKRQKKKQEDKEKLAKKEIQEYQIRYRKRSLDNFQRFKETELKVKKNPLEIFLSAAHMPKKMQKLKFSQAFFPKGSTFQNQMDFHTQQQEISNPTGKKFSKLVPEPPQENPLDKALEEEIFGHIDVTLKEYEDLEKKMRNRNNNLLKETKGEFDGDDDDDYDNSNKTKRDKEIEQIKKNYFRNHGIRRKSCECKHCGRCNPFQVKCQHLPLILKHKMKNYFTNKFFKKKVSQMGDKKEQKKLTSNNTTGRRSFASRLPTNGLFAQRSVVSSTNNNITQSQNQKPGNDKQQENDKILPENSSQKIIELDSSNNGESPLRIDKQKTGRYSVCSIPNLSSKLIAMDTEKSEQIESLVARSNILSFVKRQVDKGDKKSPKKKLVRKQSTLGLNLQDAKTNPAYSHLYKSQKRSSFILKMQQKEQNEARLQPEYRQSKDNQLISQNTISSTHVSLREINLQQEQEKDKIQNALDQNEAYFLDQNEHNQNTAKFLRKKPHRQSQKLKIAKKTDFLKLIIENSQTQENLSTFRSRGNTQSGCQSPNNNDSLKEDSKNNFSSIPEETSPTKTKQEKPSLNIDSLPKQKYFRISKGVKSVQKLRQKTISQFQSQQNSMANQNISASLATEKNNNYSEVLKDYFKDKKKKKYTTSQKPTPLQSTKKIISVYRQQQQQQQQQSLQQSQQQQTFQSEQKDYVIPNRQLMTPNPAVKTMVQSPNSQYNNRGRQATQPLFVSQNQTHNNFYVRKHLENMESQSLQNNTSDQIQYDKQYQDQRSLFGKKAQKNTQNNTSLPQIRNNSNQNTVDPLDQTNVEYIDTDQYFFPSDEETPKDYDPNNLLLYQQQDGVRQISSTMVNFSSPNQKKLNFINKNGTMIQNANIHYPLGSSAQKEKFNSLKQYFPNKRTCSKIIKLQNKRKDEILNLYENSQNTSSNY